MTMRDPAPTASSELEPNGRRRRRRLLVGTALCSTFLLFQCTKPERDFDALLPGSGGRKGSGGEGGDPGEGVATGGRRNTGGMAGGLGEGGMGGAASGGKGSGGKGSGGKGSGGSGTGGAAPSCAENTDPDCECVDGELVAKDVDGDGEGTRLCEAAPGLDCDDGDEDFVRNECGGCIKDLGGQVGDPCGDCGVLRCQGDSALVCRSPEPQPRRCSDHNTPQLCVNGTWVAQADCGGSLPVCLNGACVQCDPGPPINPVSLSGKRDHKCGSYHSDTVLYQCSDGGYWESTWKLSCYASSHEICNAATASCVTAGLRHPRDKTFEVTPEMLKGVEEKQWGRPVLDVFDSLLGSKFG